MPLNSHIRQRLFQRAACVGKNRADATAAPAEIHLIGASGAGMTALSELLLDFGFLLTGSDQSVDQTSLRQTQPTGRILKIHQGHDSAHLPTTADLVVFSPAISEDNP